MDKLKDYINKNKAAFENAQPSEGLWTRIDSQLKENLIAHNNPAGKEISFHPKKWLNWRVAASVILLLSIGFVAGKYWDPVSSHNDIISLSPKYGSEMIKYASFIDDRKKQLNTFANSNPELFSQFNNDLIELSTNFEKLRQNLPNNPNQEYILKNMIDNLIWQIDLLDHQLEVIREENIELQDDFVQSKEQPNLEKENMPIRMA